MIKVLATYAIALTTILASSLVSGQSEKTSTVADVTLKTTNVVTLTTEVTSKSISELIQNLENVKDDNVYLYISSPGGSVTAGLEFISYLKATDKQVTCVADFAASMAFAIFQACPNRLVMEHSVLMQHEASFGLPAADVPNQMSLIGLIQRQLEVMDNMQAARIGMTVAELHELTRDDWWVFGGDNKMLGTADRVVTVSCSKELMAHKIEKQFDSFFGSIDVTFSGCPLLSYPLEIKQSKGFKPPRTLTIDEIKLINTMRN